MQSAISTVVVVGSSAGGLEALTRLVAQLPAGFSAPVFLVNHMGAETTGEPFVRALNDAGNLRCSHARDGESFKRGHVYLAPSDQHTLVVKGKMLVTKGARENRYRPAIDPLFRSAAVAYGTGVIGIILTGYLDDGTSGMMAIKRCGGVSIAQDPADAAHPDMPQSVITNVGADYCVPLAQMGSLLEKLTARRIGPSEKPPTDLVIEAKIAQRVVSDLASVETLGTRVPYNCPDCGGVLWQMKHGTALRYRCHTGHAFSAAALLAQQGEKIEETLWVALRMFEERQNLISAMGKSQQTLPSAVRERVGESQVHIDRIRAMLTATDSEPLVSETPGR
jgi:two-component system, chemotaxis family, protein-glutamate methylesterase/glutaminase